jgi:hypothetical protein
VKHLSGALLLEATGLTHKNYTRLAKLARDKHLSLLRKFINYGQKSFVTLAQGVIVMKLFLRSSVMNFHNKPECLLEEVGEAFQGQTP